MRISLQTIFLQISKSIEAHFSFSKHSDFVRWLPQRNDFRFETGYSRALEFFISLLYFQKQGKFPSKCHSYHSSNALRKIEKRNNSVQFAIRIQHKNKLLQFLFGSKNVYHFRMKSILVLVCGSGLATANNIQCYW